jgi:molybdopterin synthase catalytic subunit
MMESSSSNVDSSSKYFVQVSETLPTLQECYDFVNDPGCGAISTFVGTTRDNFQGKKVTKLSYEGYVPMAEKELRKLCDDATEKFSVHKIAAVHILGDCPVGQASVILACSSPHRRDALNCCEYLIDELKARVPIWKREVYEDDASVWKENVEWKDGKRQRVMVKSKQGDGTC